MNALAILAAGSSTRLGQDKILADLGGQPVIAWSLAAAAASRAFGAVIVVAAPQSRERIAEAVSRAGSEARVCEGAATRTGSSWNALAALPDATVIVLHDGARPFAPPSLFVRCVESARREGSGVAGLEVRETVRRADEQGLGVAEIEREGLWIAQTPQAFRRDVLVRAREAAGEATFADDAAAVSAAGSRVRMVAGDRRNIKITTLEDLGYARELVEKGLAAIAAVPVG